MTELDEAASAVGALIAGADEARARVADMRERVVSARERFETDWAALTDRARVFLDQATADQHQLVAQKAETNRALEGLRHGFEELRSDAPDELDATHSGFEELGGQVETLGSELAAALAQADAVEAALIARADALQAELERAVADTERMLRDELREELAATQGQVEQDGIALNAWLSGTCVPTLQTRARELYTQLVQTEEELRAVLEAAAEGAEATSESVLRAQAEGYDRTLNELRRLADSLDGALDEFEDALDEGRGRVEGERERWVEWVRKTREGLRESLQSIKETEDYLARFTFVK